MDIAEIGDLLDQGIVIVDSGGIVVYDNARAREMLGQSRQLTGFPVSDVSHFHLLRLIERARTSGAGTVEETDVLGRTAHLEAAPLRDGKVVVLIRDTTRLRHLETVRRDFVANVSHELRTPITAISLIADTLKNGALDDRAASHDFVNRIGLEISNLNQMVEELLALSRMESGTETTQGRESIPVDSIVDALGRLQPLLDAHHQRLLVRIAEDTPAISGNVRLVEQLFRNLVHNASKYSPNGSEIELRATRAPQDFVCVQVIDHGQGIAPENLSRIFERFWKADRSRQGDHDEGSGLGLAIVKHAVEAHGGTISVESQPQHGSTFTVLMPSSPEG